MSPIPKLENSWYYLDNFEFVLYWVSTRYRDLLTPTEHKFVCLFLRLPQSSRGLLVRMVMRKGILFRRSKLGYREIPDLCAAVLPLTEMGLINDEPLVSVQQLFGLLTKSELAAVFFEPLRSGGLLVASKSAQLKYLMGECLAARTFQDWLRPRPSTVDTDKRKDAQTLDLLATDCLYQHQIESLCDRFRLMFFGNLHQDWSEFVLAELGLFTYEKVDFLPSARAFSARQDIDDYLNLHECKKRFRQSIEANSNVSDTLLEDMLKAIRTGPYGNAWIENRRGKLLFQIGQHLERQQDWAGAIDNYSGCTYPGARVRIIRVLERRGCLSEAAQRAKAALLAPESEAEQQQLQRMLPRLERPFGKSLSRRFRLFTPKRMDLRLPRRAATMSVEELVREHLTDSQTLTFYVENTLINSLFGLLCWDAIFATVPGAFFHPFQQGPADLFRTDFYARRESLFSAHLSQLTSGEYQNTIRENFALKNSIQSPFVVWRSITNDLLELALDCIPAIHLQLLFKRLLQDLRSNRSGLPDLIQFWPEQNRYQMVEVKGPGDRLQDNQIRWMNYCHTHEIPVSVCHVCYESAA